MPMCLLTDPSFRKSFPKECEDLTKNYDNLVRVTKEYSDVERITIRTSTDRFEDGHVSKDVSLWITQDESLVRSAIVDLLVEGEKTVYDVAMDIAKSAQDIIKFPSRGLSNRSTAFVVIQLKTEIITIKTHYTGGLVYPASTTFKVR